MPQKLQKNDNKALTTRELKDLLDIFGKDKELLLFYLSWIECGLNASKAYKKIHPHVTDHSAEVLGSRWLSRVEKPVIMAAYGLDLNLYMQQLKDGLKAMRQDPYTGVWTDDHFARKPYHDKLGKHLGLESDSAKTLIQNNIQNNMMSFNDFMLKVKQEIQAAPDA